MANEKDPALERAAERLVEDEMLRGPFSDVVFEQLLQWGIGKLMAASRHGLDPEVAAAHLKEFLVSIAVAAETHDVSGLPSRLHPPLFTPQAADQLASRLRTLTWSDDVDENGRRIAAALEEVL